MNFRFTILFGLLIASLSINAFADGHDKDDATEEFSYKPASKYTVEANRDAAAFLVIKRHKLPLATKS